MTTGFLYDPSFLNHDTGPGHQECRERLLNTIEYLEDQPWFNELNKLKPRIAEPQWIESVHDGNYIHHAEETCQSGIAFLDSMDVTVCTASFDIALLAAGGTLVLADELIDGKINNAFALLRPPGHHAENSMALGFCLFNNIAILTRYLQINYGLDKILILDWDVHHGNGSQHSFEEDPSVLYISTHQYPFYPGTGAYTETGVGRGAGATLNCPMAAGSTDKDYEHAFVEKILPRIDKFKPEAILISAGFDAHSSDPLAQICLSTEFFGWMTERLMEKAEQYCEGRIISLLEGGYNLEMLPRCIGTHLSVLSGTGNT